MSFLDSFHFLQPWALVLALPFSVLALWALRQQQGQRVWQRLFDAPLLARFLSSELPASARTATVIVVLVSLLLAIALAQPVWRQLPQPVYQAQSALVIALDLSASMDARDSAPSRLKQATFKIRDLLAQRREGQTALIVYAGDAFTVTPLTEDTDTIISQLVALEPGIMPLQGSRPARALTLAQTLLAQAGVQNGDLLLIGDALAGDGLDDAIAQLRNAGHRLSVLAVGTAAGAPVPGLRYRDGRPVVAALDFATMQRYAAQGGGTARQARPDNQDIQQLTAQFSASSDLRSAQAQEETHDQWVAEGPWFILLALPLLLPLFRRGVLSVALVAFSATLLMKPATPLMAAEADTFWNNLWQSQDQQAMAAWQAGDRDRAAAQFQQPDWQQAARYLQQDYKGALESLPAPETAAQWYNRGNAHARLGQFDKALAAYDQALALNPDDRAAQENRALVEQARKQLEPPQDDDPTDSDQPADSGQQGGDGAPPETPDPDGGESDAASSSESSPATPSDSADAGTGQTESGEPADNGSESGASDPPREPELPSDGRAESTAEAEPVDEQARQQEFSEALNQADALQDETPPGLEAAGQPSQPLNEQQQAREQLLNRVVDDPAGLWRRKFLYQYQQQAQPLQPGDQPW